MFSCKDIIKSELLNFNMIVMDMDKMLCRVIGEDIELKLVLVNDFGWVEVDSGYIEQVFVNMVVNARDVMLNGGRLIIEIVNIEFDE